MKHIVAHEMTDTNLVKAIVDKAYEGYAAKLAEYSPSIAWADDRNAKVSFVVMGKSIDVDFAIGKTKIKITGKLPLMFRLFEGKITKVISDEMKMWIAKAKAGEFDDLVSAEVEEAAAETGE